MKKIILSLAVLAFVACGKDEPEQPKNLNLYNPDKKVILHTVADYKVQNKALLRSTAPFNIKEVRDSRLVINIDGNILIPNWDNGGHPGQNEAYLETPTILESKKFYKKPDGYSGSLHSYNIIEETNSIVFPIEEVVYEEGYISPRLLARGEWILVISDTDIRKTDTVGYIPLPVLWENQQRFKDYFKANQFDSIYNMLENDYKIIWADGTSYKKHKEESIRAYQIEYPY